MPNEEHLKLLKKGGVLAWNQWREKNSSIFPDLSGADLSLNNRANTENAEINVIFLSSNWPIYNEEGPSEAGRFGGTIWGYPNSGVIEVKLCSINLSGTDLTKAVLSNINFTGANLTGANLTGANLTGANLSAACLINSIFDGATLTNSCLWETQRSRWSIKDVICDSVYWDKERKQVTTYKPREFEKLHSEKAKILLRYKDGINPLEIVTLPALIQHLESSYPGCKLRFKSIEDASGGAIVTIVIDEADDTQLWQMEELRVALQAEAEQKSAYIRQALEDEKRRRLLLTGEVQALERIVDKLLLGQKQNIFNIEQAGAVGPQAQAHETTFQQSGCEQNGDVE